MQTITGLAIGLTAGGTVLVGRWRGARSRELADSVAAILWVFGALSLVLTAGAVLLVEPVCRAMQVPAEAWRQAKEYLLICAAGIPPIVGYNALSSILLGLGDSRTPFLLWWRPA